MDINSIKEDLKVKIIGKEILCFDSLESTNDYAKKIISEQDITEGMVIIAGKQTNGKGRQGRAWFSPENKGIYLSFIVKPYKNIPEATVFTLRLAAIIEDWLEKFAEIQSQVDPPNDILINGKKVCGILVERLNDLKDKPAIVAGIGININLNFDDLPLELRGKATSIKMETAEEYDMAEALRTLIQELDAGYCAYLS